jgi:hypothetical protein
MKTMQIWKIALQHSWRILTKNVTGKLSCVIIKLFGRYGTYGMSGPEIDDFYRIFWVFSKRDGSKVG